MHLVVAGVGVAGALTAGPEQVVPIQGKSDPVFASRRRDRAGMTYIKTR
jgi:hypothetical protein